MAVNSEPHCPLCDCRDFVGHRFGLVRCNECGLVVDQRVFEPDMDRVLNEGAFGEEYEPESSVWVRLFQDWKSRRYLANLKQAGIRGGRLLEIGVGSGAFLRAAQNAGFDIEGCDLSKSLCERVERNDGIPMHHGDMASLPVDVYDVVCMHHVLEHVRDPVSFLRAALDRLRPTGVLHLAVPNAASWEAGFSGWNCYVYYHLIYFEPSSFKKVLNKAGFILEREGSYDQFSTWFLTALRTMGGFRSMDAPAIQDSGPHATSTWRKLAEHPYRIAMIASGIVTWPLRIVQSRSGYGDELWAVARKRV